MTLGERIAGLGTLTGAQTRAEWRKLFGTPAPSALGEALIARAIAARWQEQVHGGLSKAELRQIGVQARKDQRTPRGLRAPTVKPGTWLARTWHGEVHEVVVLDGAFDYRGRRYKSLSAIARHITGAAWSGPRFFGLHSPRLGSLGVTRRG